jgi:hypothetical protein
MESRSEKRHNILRLGLVAVAVLGLTTLYGSLGYEITRRHNETNALATAVVSHAIAQKCSVAGYDVDLQPDSSITCANQKPKASSSISSIPDISNPLVESVAACIENGAKKIDIEPDGTFQCGDEITYPTLTQSPSPTPLPTETMTLTSTPEPSETPTPTQTQTPIPSPTETGTLLPTETPVLTTIETNIPQNWPQTAEDAQRQFGFSSPKFWAKDIYVAGGQIKWDGTWRAEARQLRVAYQSNGIYLDAAGNPLPNDQIWNFDSGLVEREEMSLLARMHQHFQLEVMDGMARSE